MNKIDFYESVAKLLECETEINVPYHGASKITRWNNRKPGNGRYIGYGIVRMYSVKLIQIDIYHPEKLKANVESPEAALELISNMKLKYKNL